MWGTVRRLVAEGATVLLTTQYLDEADALADEISVFDRGRVIAHGTPHELKRVVGGQSLLAGRAVLKIRRTPEQLIDVTLQPIIFLLLFVYVFGGAIAGNTHDYLQFVLPAIMVQTVIFSSLASA